jgi:general secretion pathway protein C
MAALPDPATPTPPSLFGTLATAALVVVLAALLAKWTWVFVAPAPSAAPAPAAAAIDLAAVASLFGGEAPAGQAAGGNASGLRLKGVVAPTPATIGSAVFSVGGRDVAVNLGTELQPGVRLVEVQPDHAVVSRAGVRERVDLDARHASASRATGASTGRKAAGFRLPVTRSGSNAYAFSRKDLENALKDPAQLGYLGRIGTPKGGGVRLDEAPPGSLAARLGMQPGDVIRRVNGQNIASAGDLARLYQQFANTSLIQADILRGGSSVRLSYAIKP